MSFVQSLRWNMCALRKLVSVGGEFGFSCCFDKLREVWCLLKIGCNVKY